MEHLSHEHSTKVFQRKQLGILVFDFLIEKYIKRQQDTENAMSAGSEAAGGHAGLVSIWGRVLASRASPIYSKLEPRS